MFTITYHRDSKWYIVKSHNLPHPIGRLTAYQAARLVVTMADPRMDRVDMNRLIAAVEMKLFQKSLSHVDEIRFDGGGLTAIWYEIQRDKGSFGLCQGDIV